MWEESSEAITPLRTGLTTGTCATACAVAAAKYLLAKQALNVVSVTLPKGSVVELDVSLLTMTDYEAKASTIKDAGDDPDVTHGATIFVSIKLVESAGIAFFADAGVGVVTRAGLSLEIGEPAINPTPRAMMVDHLEKIADFYGYTGGFEVSVGVVNGEMIAQKTMNPRLGIIGGLSILGTTGIVRPFSCAAWIASIHQGIDVAVANGHTHIAASTGNMSESVIQKKYQLDPMALIEMGDFAGAVLKYINRYSLEKISICGGFGKISKLANQHMDLNSRASSIDFTMLAMLAKELGAKDSLQEKIINANTSIEAWKHCEVESIALADHVCEKALLFAQSKISKSIEIEIIAIDRQSTIIGSATNYISQV